MESIWEGGKKEISAGGKSMIVGRRLCPGSWMRLLWTMDSGGGRRPLAGLRLCSVGRWAGGGRRMVEVGCGRHMRKEGGAKGYLTHLQE